MAKRYYWLKLMDDFLMAIHCAILKNRKTDLFTSNFCLKFCLKSDGIFMRLVGTRMILHDIVSLAKLTNVLEETVAVVLKDRTG